MIGLLMGNGCVKLIKIKSYRVAIEITCKNYEYRGYVNKMIKNKLNFKGKAGVKPDYWISCFIIRDFNG